MIPHNQGGQPNCNKISNGLPFKTMVGNTLNRVEWRQETANERDKKDGSVFGKQGEKTE